MSQKQQDKIKKLNELYDISVFYDLFTLVPQEMEVAEVKGMAYGWDGARKKEEVIETMHKLFVKQGLVFNEDAISAFIDVIDAASKGKYALNKEKS